MFTLLFVYKFSIWFIIAYFTKFLNFHLHIIFQDEEFAVSDGSDGSDASEDSEDDYSRYISLHYYLLIKFKFFREINISLIKYSSEDVSEDDESGGLDSDESEGKDWSDLEREAAEDDEESDDDRGMLFTFILFTNFHLDQLFVYKFFIGLLAYSKISVT